MQKLEVYERRRSYSDTYTYITIRASECTVKEKTAIENAYFDLVKQFDEDLKVAEIGVRGECTKLSTEVREEPVKDAIKSVSVTKTQTAQISDEYEVRIIFKTSVDTVVNKIHEMINTFRAMQS